ncbi:energy-coupling factor transporter ATPase [uncultured Senegalimassilia sp.]|uniref:energy-coupling factor transporter ATPase n=1 Tax=uncultured Senegalimassilia sp. TaxID=1714350 RepID=UPI0026775BA6|nr:energy-coupling factor transporter ATPase [uncultured Senegalimassilia sp.]
MIDIDNVRFTYDGVHFALDGVSAHVETGEFLCILGGNGSGKSTLAKHLNALLVPDEGRVVVDGMDTADAECTYAVRKTCGMVFQNPDDQLVASLVEDDVAFGPENLGIPTPELRERVTQALEDVGLSGFERHETHALSGGQKQRVAIAGVLAMNPSVLVLDEASAMLDPRGRAGLMRVCHELHERGMTIVMITHFMEEAAQVDRVIVMERGRVALEGTPDEVLLRADALDRLNLDVPFAARLSLDARRAGVNVAPTVNADELAQRVLALAGAGAQSPAAGGAYAPAAQPVAAAEDSQEGAGSSQAESASGNGSNAFPTQEAAARTPASFFASAGIDATGSQTGSENDNGDLFPACSEMAGKLVSVAASGDAGAVSAGTGTPLIEFCDVSFTYDAAEAKRQRKRGGQQAKRQAKWGNAPDSLWAIRNVSFAVHQGEFFGIAGHTGSGKSTIIQHMNGILKPTSGQVLVMGADISDKRCEASLRGSIGVVFQYPEHQLFAETVYKDVAFGPRNLGLKDNEVDARVRESLERVGLAFDEVAEKSPFELSGGQQRRVAFAGVLAMNPRVLVLDEPAAGLDPASRTSFLGMISRLHQQGLTVVMVSHSMDDLARMCDRVAIMNEGQLLGIGAPDQLFLRAAELKRVGLGTTEAQAFASELAAGGMAVEAGKLYNEQDLVDLVARACSSEEAGANGCAGVAAGSATGTASAAPEASSPAASGNAERAAADAGSCESTGE